MSFFGFWVIPVEWIINEGGGGEEEKEREKEREKKEKKREEDDRKDTAGDMMLMDAANRTKHEYDYQVMKTLLR